MSLVAAFEPIWILTAVGYGARRAGLLGEDAALVLSRYVFNLAMPAGLFLTLSRTPLSHVAGTALLAFALSTVLVTGAGWVGSGMVAIRRNCARPVRSPAVGSECRSSEIRMRGVISSDWNSTTSARKETLPSTCWAIGIPRLAELT